jgi:hypothetical protein
MIGSFQKPPKCPAHAGIVLDHTDFHSYACDKLRLSKLFDVLDRSNCSMPKDLHEQLPGPSSNRLRHLDPVRSCLNDAVVTAARGIRKSS